MTILTLVLACITLLMLWEDEKAKSKALEKKAARKLARLRRKKQVESEQYNWDLEEV